MSILFVLKMATTLLDRMDLQAFNGTLENSGPLALSQHTEHWSNFLEKSPTLFSGWLEGLAFSFERSALATHIDFQSLGWALFLMTLLIYVVSKEQWLRLRRDLQEFHMYDPLTRLPNRRLFVENVRNAIRHSKRKKQRFALVMADLDRFNQVNDTLGHNAGDRLLAQVGDRLQQVIRNSDLLARLGGDEFGFLLNGLESDGDASQLAQRILSVMDEPMPLEGLNFKVGISLGIAIYPDHGEDVETLLRRADISLFRAKERRNCYTFYDKDTDEYNRKNIQMLNDLRVAINEGALEVYYQPKVDCDTHKVKGLEALARWNHPEQGMISPGVFIPLAKKNGLIRELTMFMLQTSVRQISDLYQDGIDLKLSVNITEENLEDVRFPEEVAYILTRNNFPPHCLELEITEDVIIENIQNATLVTDKLSALGVCISIDDFGTGNSSISYLKKLPIHTLKIDLSFIREMNRNPDDAAIVKTTILLSKSLGLSVVAEGVEDELTLQKLNDWGCDLAQGFYVCKPVPNQELVNWLQSSQWKPQLRSETPEASEPSNVTPLRRKQVGDGEV